jgi:addiction module RelE/StbE family toxin
VPKSKLTLRYLPIAVEDLTAIIDWIALDSPIRAGVFIENLEKRIGALEEQPLMGRLPRNERLKAAGYRVLILDDYLVFYVVRGQVIQIHRVVHGSRLTDAIL